MLCVVGEVDLVLAPARITLHRRERECLPLRSLHGQETFSHEGKQKAGPAMRSTISSARLLSSASTIMPILGTALNVVKNRTLAETNGALKNRYKFPTDAPASGTPTEWVALSDDRVTRNGNSASSARTR
jgi:hypothetical protein